MIINIVKHISILFLGWYNHFSFKNISTVISFVVSPRTNARDLARYQHSALLSR